MLKVQNTNTGPETIISNESVLLKPFTDISTGLLLLRLILGIVFAAHGSQKVLGWFGGPGLDGTVGFMSSMGIPVVLAYIAAFTEFLGGLALIVGLLTRPAALGILIVMLVAIVKVHLPAGFFAPKGFEFPLTLGVISFVIFILGPGRISLDHKLLSKKEKKQIGYLN